MKPLGPGTGVEVKVAELEGYFWFPLRGGIVTGGDQLLLGSFTCVHLATCLYPRQTVFFPRAEDRELIARNRTSDNRLDSTDGVNHHDGGSRISLRLS